MPTRVEHVCCRADVAWDAVSRGEFRVVVSLPHCRVAVVSLDDLDRLEELERFFTASDEIYRPDKGLRCLECGVERRRWSLADALLRDRSDRTPGCSMCEAAPTRLPA